MKINILSRERLTVEVHNADELFALRQAHHLSPAYMQAALRDLEHTGRHVFSREASQTSLKAAGGFVRIETGFRDDSSPLKPYWDVLNHKLGARPFTVDLIPGLRHPCIQPTHYLEKLGHDATTGFLSASLVMELYHFIGHSFDDEGDRTNKATADAHDMLRRRLLKEYPVCEFLEVGGGLYKKNPEWGLYRRPRFVPCIADDRLLVYMADEWSRLFARQAQRDMIARVHRPDSRGKAWINDRDQCFYIDGCNEKISFEEFKGLAAAPC